MLQQDFVVDDHPGHRDPRKMLASRLELNVHMITVSTQEHNALLGAVNQAHLIVEETVFDALAACYAAVLPEKRREGIAVVDIGAQSTEMVVYYGDARPWYRDASGNRTQNPHGAPAALRKSVIANGFAEFLLLGPPL